MEVLLEYEGSRRVVRIPDTEATEALQLIYAEIQKFGDVDINRSLESQSQQQRAFSLQKWSEKWKCYVNLDDDAVMYELKDGDRITIKKKNHNTHNTADVQVSAFFLALVMVPVALLCYNPVILGWGESSKKL